MGNFAGMTYTRKNFLIHQYDFRDKSVLITGGTGSFGQAFIKYVIRTFPPRRLIVFSRDELKQFDMQQELDAKAYSCLRFFIGDVRDRDRLELAMRGVHVVIHAAALKQVPAAEYNPFECIRTNVHGAENVVTAAMRTGVERVIALSTDKAVNPINLYGASKLASDKIFVAANNLRASGDPVYSVVRYGNVMGSRGSVVPFFKKLVTEEATALPITDPEMTRFWITLAQGVEFVISSLAMMQGGEIFVPKIPSTKITELASHIAPQLPQTIVGIRPGEKVHEVLISEDDARLTMELDDRYVILPQATGPFAHYADLGGKRVPAGFKFGSNNNPERLTADDLEVLLNASANN